MTVINAEDLTLEVKETPDATVRIGPAAFTPAIDSDYWIYRVRLTETQAVVGFFKFATVGIGFAVEKADWNTNLPYRCDAEDIYRHIQRNTGVEPIDRATVLVAIEKIQTAAHRLMKTDPVTDRLPPTRGDRP